MVVDDSSSAESTDDQDIEEDPFRTNDSYTTIEFSDLPIEVKLYLHGEMPNHTTSCNYTSSHTKIAKASDYIGSQDPARNLQNISKDISCVDEIRGLKILSKHYKVCILIIQ